jgi:SP family galactose:H+ symporter-like MFS transporter
MKPIIYVIALAAATAGLLFGLDIGVIAGALQFIQVEFKISDVDWALMQGQIVSCLLVGATIGALFSGTLSSKLGRKVSLLIAAVVFIIGSAACAMAPTTGMLMGARFFLGLAVGIASFVCPLYLSEVAPAHLRGGMVSMYQLMITLGILAAAISDAVISSNWFLNMSHIENGHQWRVMLGVLMVPSAIMFLCILILPRSPRWLMRRGHEAEAREVLCRIRNSEVEADAELDDIRDDLKEVQKGFEFFTGNSNFRRAVFLGFGLQVIQQLTGINVVMYYAPKILQNAGYASTNQQMWGNVLIDTVNMLSTFIAIFFVDKWGRKPIMYTGFVVMGLAMSTLGLMFKMGGGDTVSQPVMAMAAILIFILGFAMSAGPIIWVLCSEIFPLSGRDFGITVSTGTNWIVNAFVGFSFPLLLQKLGSGNTFLAYGGLEILFFFFFIKFVPETKGRTLEHISNNLLAGKALKDLGDS